MDSPTLHQSLQKLRSDRRKLLEFLMSSGLVKKITTTTTTTTPEGPTDSIISDIDFDSLSTDYVLECIQSGGALDVSQATKRYHEESSHPIVQSSRCGDVFYLTSDPETSGSPPLRAPPSIPVKEINPVEKLNNSSVKLSSMPSHENGTSSRATTAPDYSSQHWEKICPLGLPNLRTGLKDDDLRQSAYEVFLACTVFSGVETQSTEGIKKEKSPKRLVGLTNRRVKRQIESESPVSHLKVLDTIRVQMQISEATDVLIRRRLTQFSSVNSFEKIIDVPQLSLVLLTGILRSDFTSPKLYLHWKNRQANTFEELVSSDLRKTEKQSMVSLLAKIRNLEEWDIKMSPSERSDVLLTLRQVALELSSMPGRFGMVGETYYWTSGYHLNIRLYEKLLFCVFDILDESQLIEEAEEILKLVKLTWPVLGITERLHNALFAWVLFQQFVATKEMFLLDNAICEIEKVLSVGVYDESEVAYLKSLLCFPVFDGCEIRSDLLQSILTSINSWCDHQLQDYHLNFSQKLPHFERVLKLGLLSAVQELVPHGNIELTGSRIPHEIAVEKIKIYVEKSFLATCSRVSDTSVSAASKDKLPPLNILARELRLIAEEDFSLFCPIFRPWYPECAKISAKLLHRFYGERLEPLLKDETWLTEEVREVLPAAYALERCLIQHYFSASKKDSSHCGQEFELYPIADFSRSIILDWVVAQNERILEWTGRAFDLEEWEPLSSQQKHAVSAVEVFRIVEETVDRFFEWSLPMDITHLQALLSVIFHSLDAYLSKVISQLVDKQNLYPPTPPLTRYKEATFPIIKKKVVENLIMEHQTYSLLDELTASKLCIRLNTYRYIQRQTSVLEEGIRKSWVSLISYQTNRCSTEKGSEALDETDLIGESVTELFVATLDCIRDSAAQAIRKTSDFLGAKIIFWDMRDTFLNSLYHGSVEGHRIEGVLPQFDSVLNSICGLIDDSIRDLVVSSIWRASQEGFMRVLLDGGPSRAFSATDIAVIEEDFNMLKDMFVADGEGLPRSLVEEDAKFYHQILSLFSLQTESLIHMLMASSEHLSIGVNSYKNGPQYLGDAQTIIRILCHKKDREASKFLKRQYQLPPSSEYDETGSKSPNLSSPLVADIWKRTASIRWSEKGQNSFRSFKKKLQDATW